MSIGCPHIVCKMCLQRMTNKHFLICEAPCTTPSPVSVVKGMVDRWIRENGHPSEKKATESVDSEFTVIVRPLTGRLVTFEVTKSLRVCDFWEMVRRKFGRQTAHESMTFGTVHLKVDETKSLGELGIREGNQVILTGRLEGA
jgi:hypothetical protein